MQDDDVTHNLPPADYADALEVAKMLAPDAPLHLLRPKMIYARAAVFVDEFPGTTAYAIRANPEPKVLGEVFSAGIDWYACDTLSEIETVARQLPDARILYMHPIKPEQGIELAYRKHRIRDFVIDHPDELRKIRAHAGTDCTLIVRVGAPPGALQGEGYRFGCDIDKAAFLAREVVEAGFKLGLSFHLGSQILDPALFDEAFLILREVMYKARYQLDLVCVGGGFPSIYEGLWPPATTDYFASIKRGLARLHLPRTCRVFCTPGRALVADCISILVRVEQRRGQLLYINDGLMGALGNINLQWCQPPVRLVRPQGRPPRDKFDKYLFSGPACYGDDTMPGPFYLPEDAKAGDFIEIGQCGAYAGSMVAAFHSLPWPEMVTVADDPPIPRRAEELPEDYYSGNYEPDDDEEIIDDSNDDDISDDFEDVTRKR
jgi:ornithine decarboxylase